MKTRDLKKRVVVLIYCFQSLAAYTTTAAEGLKPADPKNDAALLDLYLASADCGGSKTVFVKIKNAGSETLKTLVLNVSYRGVTYPNAYWNGELLTGQTLDSLPVGVIKKIYGDAKLKGWIRLPNGNPDENTWNDSLVKDYNNIRLAGIYSIGGTKPDFTDIRQAALALKKNGICADVQFNLRPGIYSDSLTFPIVNGSGTNGIKFRSENGDSSSVIIQNFQTAVPTYVFQFPSATGNVKLEKLTFNLVAVTSEVYGILLKPATANVDGVEFLNCRFLSNNKLNRMINIEGSDYSVKGKVINTLFSGPATNFYSENKSMIFSYEIGNNVFTGSEDNILVNANAGMIYIHDNRFLPSGTNWQQAISLNNMLATIERNSISANYSIPVSVSNGTYYIRNNYIEMDQVNDEQLSAIRISFTDTLSYVAYNTIRIKANANCRAIEANAGTGAFIKNNMFIHEAKTGLAIYNIGNTPVRIDYNRYFTNSPRFGSHDGYTFPTFGSWRAESGFDQHSQFQETQFAISPGYKVIGVNDINNAAIPVKDITTDIENSVRDALTPDIGAYEYNSTNGIWPEREESAAEVFIYPNPYSGSTTISYHLEEKSNVEMEIYNSVGQQIERSVFSGQSPGSYTHTFGAIYKGYAAGVYMLKININGKISVKKMTELNGH